MIESLHVALDGTETSAQLDRLVDEIAQDMQAGRSVDVEAYIREHPEFAEPLRRLIPSMRALADLGHSVAESSQPATIEDRTKTAGLLGDFRILGEIGRGGMGVVYEAEQVSLSRRVALKVLPFAAVLDERQIKRFRNEALAAAQLDHPHIVNVYGVGCERSVHFYAMRFIEGHSLAAVIHQLHQHDLGLDAAAPPAPADQNADSAENRPSLTSQDETSPMAALSTARTERPREYFRALARIGTQVADALEYAHQHGIIHRDIKPANILIDKSGKAWVTDFGLAHMETSATLTVSGDLLGTLRYMSPEQALGRQVGVDHRTDIYSLGITMYELVTMQPAFSSPNRQTLLRQLAEDEPVLPRRRNPAVPADLETIITKCIAKLPAERYATAAELAADLRRFLDDQVVQARRPTWRQRAVKWSRRHRPIVCSAAAAGLLVLTSAMGMLAYSRAHIQSAFDEKVAAVDQLNEALDREQSELYFQRVALAQRELQNGFLVRVKPLLEACRPEHRQWEWYYLSSICDVSHRTFRGHEWRVEDVAFSHDGALVASAGWDGTVRIWNVATGRQEQVLQSYKGIPGGVAFSPDRRWLVAGGLDCVVRVWDLNSGEMRTLRDPSLDGPDPRVANIRIDENVARPGEEPLGGVSHSWSVRSVAFSPDGSLIASGGDDYLIKLWDAESGKLRATLVGHNGVIPSIAFHPDGHRLVSGADDRTVRVWDLRDLDDVKLAMPPLEGHQLAVSCVTFDPQGHRIASASYDQTVKLWHAETGEEWMTIRDHTHAVSGVAFDAAGRRLVSACVDSSCIVWNVETGTEIATLRGHDQPTQDVAFSPVSNLIVTASWDRTVKLWDPETATNDDGKTLVGHEGWIESVAFSHNGKMIASASRDGTARLWDADSCEMLQTLDHGTREAGGSIHSPMDDDWKTVRSIAFTADDRRVVTGGVDRKVRIWDVKTGALVDDSLKHPLPVYAVAVSPDGRRLAAGGGRDAGVRWLAASEPLQEAPLRVWNMETGEIVPLEKCPVRDVMCVAFSDDGRWMVAGSRDKTCRVWDAQSGRLQTEFRGHSGELISSVCFNHDASRVLSCCIFDEELDPGEIIIWDRSSGEVVLNIGAGEGTVPCLCARFSPDERRIVAASVGTVLLLFDAKTGHLLISLPGHLRETQCVEFSSDGRRIVSGGMDNRLKMWEAPGFTTSVAH